jgi:hypothetical protein
MNLANILILKLETDVLKTYTVSYTVN